jgi:prepilin-type N-terminal cleavage/methylation domain-containing protein
VTLQGSKSGFTLVELMIAVSMLAIGILGMAQVFAVADRHTAYSREETTAVYLAQEIREKILSETFTDIVSIFDNTDTEVPESVREPSQDWAQHLHDRMGPTGRGTVQVDTPADDPALANGMVGVRIVVSWREGSRTVEVPVRFAIAKTTS